MSTVYRAHKARSKLSTLLEVNMTFGKDRKVKKATKAADKAFAKAQKATGKKADKYAKLAEKNTKKAHKLSGKKVNAFQKAANKQGKQAQKSFQAAAKDGSKKLHDVQETLVEKIQEQIENATPVVESAVSDARVKAAGVAAVVADKLADAEVSPQVEAVATKVTGDKKALKKAQKHAVKAAKQYSKQQKKASKKGRKGLLALGLVGSAAAAGYSAYKASRPVEDPWKTPAVVEPKVETVTVVEKDVHGKDVPATVDTVKTVDPKVDGQNPTA
ncbi:hypothetical protein AB0O14_18180 [Microbacterium foliorum]